ncbi:PREDICTED: E3 ubiquitin-protein ligase LRSAM1-like, partial [Acropora digitifera]|uniref:E3 ubiquitin-protein ligase LRSAM1-like n=1 Tax=Acropora digitifera TaxID=70779 RepID=UPI00077A0BEF
MKKEGCHRVTDKLRFPDSFLQKKKGLLTSLAILLTGVGVTVISYDSENRAFVQMAVIDVGCYSWDIHYIGANLCQITIPTEVSSHCEQHKYRHECFHSKSLTLNTNSNNSNAGLACELICTKIFQFISMMCKFSDNIVIFILFHIKVPKGVYSLCKVLQKEALLMFDNALTNLKGGGSLKDLSALRVLDLHDNFITTLPADIDQLKALQVLNVQNNKLKSLPPSIGNLPSLQTLNLQANDLHALPPEIGNSKSLRTLNISGNSNLQGVPPNLAHVRTIETIVLDTDRINFPPKDISFEGTASIMKYLCKVAGIEYVPPSKHLLNVLDPVGNESSSSKHCGPTPVDDLIANTLSLHEAEKEKRRQQLLEIERQIHETEQEQQALAALANKQRIDLVDKIRIAEAEMDDLTMHQQQQQDLERQKLVSAMAADEQLANDTVAMILQVNERAQKTEIILDELEQERMRTDHLVKITQEETERLKKEEVLASMAKLLESQESQGRLIREYERSREKAASQAMNESWEADMRLVGILNEQYDDRDALISEISKE